MLRLTNPVQHYDWGSLRDIPQLLGIRPDGRPYAELWFGAHPTAPSLACAVAQPTSPGQPGQPDRADGEPLDRVIDADPVALLGPAGITRFGARLPYLVKLLAAAKPLSLQAHPSSTDAEVGYAREEADDIPAPERNYPDASHKPELLVALDRTIALAGFRDPDDAADGLARIGSPATGEVVAALRASGTPSDRVRAGFAAALALSDPDVAAIVAVLRRRERAQDGGELRAEDIARILVEHAQDAGVVASFLLGSVQLEPGQGLYVGAGVVHAYISGFGIEVMASSDNVLRAGLTSKRVDAAELMRIVDFRPSEPHRVAAVGEPVPGGVELTYRVPLDDFRLSMIQTRSRQRESTASASAGPRIAVCLEGAVSIAAGGERVDLTGGESVFVPDADGPITVAGHGRIAVVGTGV